MSTPNDASPSSQQAPSSRIGFVKKYAISIPGFLRLGLIAFLFASWVSAAAVLKPSYGTADLPSNFASARGAILFFSIVGNFICIVIYVTHVANIVNLSKLAKIPWNLLVLISDILGIIPTFILAIVAAVRENDLKLIDRLAVSKGAFASASVFGFLASLLFAADAIYYIVLLCKNGVKSPPPGA